VLILSPTTPTSLGGPGQTGERTREWVLAGGQVKRATSGGWRRDGGGRRWPSHESDPSAGVTGGPWRRRRRRRRSARRGNSPSEATCSCTTVYGRIPSQGLAGDRFRGRLLLADGDLGAEESARGCTARGLHTHNIRGSHCARWPLAEGDGHAGRRRRCWARAGQWQASGRPVTGWVMLVAG
jgi:hypothetical protein